MASVFRRTWETHSTCDRWTALWRELGSVWSQNLQLLRHIGKIAFLTVAQVIVLLKEQIEYVGRNIEFETRY
jgi:hypothetical protein